MCGWPFFIVSGVFALACYVVGLSTGRLMGCFSHGRDRGGANAFVPTSHTPYMVENPEEWDSDAALEYEKDKDD